MALVERPETGWLVVNAYAARANAVDALIGVGAEFGRLLKVWRGRIQQRREIARLDDRMLADIGLSQVEASREVNKPFWQD